MNGNRSHRENDWQAELARFIPLFGHRNWIVIVDSAYPAHSNPGIVTIATFAEQLDVLRQVLNEIRKCGHIRAQVYTDSELKMVAEQDAPGVDAYRLGLGQLLKTCETEERAHEEIISELDHDAAVFQILVLKTTLQIPYTSVFLRLDCGYWTSGAEARLRDRMWHSDLEHGKDAQGAKQGSRTRKDVSERTCVDQSSRVA